MKFFKIAAVLLIAGLIAGCGQGSKKAKQDLSKRTIKVVATTGMIGDAVSNVGGDRVSVTTLMGPGIDPHLYKASEGDVRVMSNADIIFYNGIHLEGKVTEVLENMHGMGIATHAVAESVPEEKLVETEGAADPHVWFDIGLWKYVIKSIEESLSQLDPGHSDTYKSQSESYLKELDELQTYVIEKAQSIPENNRVLITAHDAFAYFGNAYGFEVHGLQGVSTATEAGTADVQNLAKFIAERKIPAIFVESSIPVRTLEAVQAAVESRNFQVNIGGELFSDAMGDPGTPEGKYLGMFLHNIDTITNALSGDSGK